MKDLLTIIDESNITSFDSYKKIAEKLMNDYKLQVRDKYYRIVECEFYYSSKRYQDPYVHGHQRQKESNGEWYFHGSGLDITLSNGESYGGILIRAIAEVKPESPIPAKKDTYIGPLNVCTEIFKQVGNIIATTPLNFGLVDISKGLTEDAKMEKAKVFAIPRIGLNQSKDTQDNYCGRPYRFITFLNLPHKETDKIKKYLTEEAIEPLGIEEYRLYYKGDKW